MGPGARGAAPVASPSPAQEVGPIAKKRRRRPTPGPPPIKNPPHEAKVGDEVEALYTNGPAGGGGARKHVSEQIGIVSVLLDRARVAPRVTLREWSPHAEVA